MRYYGVIRPTVRTYRRLTVKVGVHFGTTTRVHFGTTTTTALAVLEFDVRHAFIVVGDRCLRQVIGIVMGSSLSAIAALMALA